MIVVGGWPGRNVVGLNGRFGVRPADFASLGDFANPFANDVDPGDETTEFVGVVTSLPGSGTVVFDDDGGFQHTGAADGTYSTVFDLFTWAQGGPVTAHGAETITTTFGTTGAGVTLTAAASLIAGSASGAVGATAAGATLTAAAALSPGAATGEGVGVAPGTIVPAAASLLAGTATGSSSATAAGVTIAAAASLAAGAAAGSSSGGGTIDPAAFWGYILSNGQSVGDNIVAIRQALENRPTVGDIANAVWNKVLP